MAGRTGIVMAKNYKEYSIKRPEFTDSIKIRIYKTPESMRKGYLEERAKYTREKYPGDLTGTMGLFFNIGYMVSDKIDGRFTGDVYGIMFLNEKFLTPEIAIHESVHATFTHEHNIERFGMDYSEDESLIHEERFAYYVGWLSYTVLDLLKKQGDIR
jgi:hypothetical protein